MKHPNPKRPQLWFRDTSLEKTPFYLLHGARLRIFYPDGSAIYMNPDSGYAEEYGWEIPCYLEGKRRISIENSIGRANKWDKLQAAPPMEFICNL